MEVDSDVKDKEQSLKSRPYQNQILEIALTRNVIIYLPTGSGKTYIAILAMKEMSKPLENRLDEGGKRIVFLVNTVALARQQFECIRSLVNLKVRLYTGDMNVDNWKREKWREEFNEHQVFVATAQIILDVVRHGFISITDFNLMIFDECHHAVNDHPMNQLMSHFQNHRAEQLPRVIGLTGLLLKSSSPDTIESDLTKMEAIFRATIVTASDDEQYQNVLLYSTKPCESTIRYSARPASESVCKKVEALSAMCLAKVIRWDIDTAQLKATKNMEGYRVANPIKKHKNYMTDFHLKMEDMGIYGASIAILSFMVEFELSKRAAESQAIRNLSRLCISYAERIRHELVHYMKANDDFDADDEYELHEMIYDNSTQKIQTLLGYLEKTFTGKNPKDISCLVFVERRQTAKCLYYLIKHYVESKQSLPIVPEFMVGQRKAMPDSIETWLDTKRQRNVLRKFKRGDCNLLVASSVLEEGIDVQSCNYVIIYDRLKHFGAYVQTKGRARMSNSFYTIMIENGDLQKFITNIKKWKTIEENLRKFLVGKTIERMLPLQEEIDEQFTVEIEPFYTKKGAMLEAGSVVQLLNRYCMALPQDVFTSTTVQWSKENTGDKKIMVRLVMPPQSTIKHDIVSDKMESAKMAKRSAAMKACIQLYENRELNENLLPISKVNCFERVEDVYFKHWEEFQTDNARLAGTGKCRRLHKIQHPSELFGAMPTVGKPVYLYNIQMKPSFAADSTNEWIVKLLTTSSTFALLTSKQLPRLASMPSFLSQGQVVCELSATPLEISLPSEEHLMWICRFHVALFRDLLDTWNSFFTLNFTNKENSFCIVPTKNGVAIDWELVRRCQGLQKPHELSEIKRRKLNLDPAEYENSVVCPWYSADQSTRYVVLKVLTHMSPRSAFPSGEYNSYAEYVKEKYGQNIVANEQFLLHVQPITSRRNTIHPGDGAGGRRKKTRRYDDIKLIPELCHNFKFPGDLWQKAVFLSAILHRIRYLLLAEEVRISINTYLGIDYRNHQPHMLPVEKLNSEEEEDASEVSIEDDGERSNSSRKAPRHIDKDEVDIMDGQCNWSEHEEPADIDRKMDDLYEVELDYYMQFLSNAVATLKLDESESAKNQLLALEKTAKIEAICGEPGGDGVIRLLRARGEINQAEVLVALTRKSAADVFDMERLELLGDSFLKFGASLYIFDRHMAWNEGCLTALKGRLVSNRNLFYLSTRLELPGKINMEQFDPRNEWQPPLVAVPFKVQQAIQANGVSPYVLFRLNVSDEEVYKGDVNDDTMHNFLGMFPQEQPCADSSLVTFLGQRMIGDKCCSDIMEALLGVCVKNLGVECSFRMLNYLGICPKDDGKDISKLIERVSYKPRVNPSTRDSTVDMFLTNYHQIEEKLGYQFKDRGYLLQALTHPSYTLNRVTGCYQVLEFIGDAVLDFLVSAYIFERCSHMGPGELTDLRSALVNNTFLACLTVKYKFHLHLLNQSVSLMKAIEHFVRFQEFKDNKITDQVRILVQEQDCAIADYIEVPKALGDIFESLVGAVFLDSGNSLDRTWSVIYKLMSEELAIYAQNVPKQLVRQLMEDKGANAKFMPAEMNEDLVMVACQFTCRGKLCEVNGFGSNKEGAKISAAKLALQALAK